MPTHTLASLLLLGAATFMTASQPLHAAPMAGQSTFGAKSTLTAGQPGPRNAITDVPGILVGQFNKTDDGYLTGTTVIYAPGRAVGGVDVRGGAPGTRETDLLDPRNLVQRVDAIVLTGGSAYGLDAATGVMRWLREHEHGFPVGKKPAEVVPIVPGAVIYDLGRGGQFTATPDADFGYRAIAAASDGPIAQGNAGAGTGAKSGALKGGVGTASVVLADGRIVGALVVVNSFGSAVDPATCRFYAEHLQIGDEFGLKPDRQDLCAAATAKNGDDARSMNTTIAVVATNAPLDKAQASKMASVAQDGLARAISPVHTLYDGDTVFALSASDEPAWSTHDRAADLNAVYTAAADTLSRAVVHALRAAQPAARWPSYCRKYPAACAN